MSIHQPAYLPWLGYFDKIARSDLFIYLDTVQFQKSSFQNRNKILSKDGPIWLTVPVETSGVLYTAPLKDIRLSGNAWQRKHLTALQMNYGGAIRAQDVLADLQKFYLAEWKTLSDLCWSMLEYFSTSLGIENDIVRASELKATGGKSDLILELCKEVGATTYLSGALGRDYLNLADFRREGIAVEFQDYKHPTYKQLYPGFVPNMGVVDLLMNERDPSGVLGLSQVATW